MLRLFALTFWLLAFIVALFVLAIEVWEGAPLWYFVGAVLLGVIYLSGTWIIVKRYPETGQLAWVLLGVTGGIIAARALLWLVALLWA